MRFDGATALGALRRGREAASLRPLVGQGGRSTVPGGKGGAQVKGGRDQAQGERELISDGVSYGYCGSTLFDPTRGHRRQARA